MRLLDTNKLELKEFNSNPPPYAILSHVWGNEEVEYKDIMDLSKAEKMYGYKKIEYACKRALEDGYKYIWIDTCCINKESSAELSEAINSMFGWYTSAAVCYAYLPDVPWKENHEDLSPGSAFQRSCWFTRGWTLQELIAPSQVDFYSYDWVKIGNKVSLQKPISVVTRISIGVIVGSTRLENVSVAAKMSWAANRQTKRIEDRAYSLMGLFGIYMAPLYGELENAFIRLQHEIIRKTYDHSIFSWTASESTDGHRGILARSPDEFCDSREIEMPAGMNVDSIQKPYSITNRGLEIELPVMHIQLEDGKNKILAALDCHFPGKTERIGITLVQADSLRSGQYVRAEAASLVSISENELPSLSKSLLYIADDYSSDPARDNKISVRLRVRIPRRYGKPNITSQRFMPINENKLEWKAVITPSNPGTISFEEPHKDENFTVLVGVGDSGAWCSISTGQVRDGSGAGRAGDISRSVDSITSSHQTFSLTEGWSVGATLHIIKRRVNEPAASSPTQVSTNRVTQKTSFTHEMEVEIKKLSDRTSVLEEPNGYLGCRVKPPASKQGFRVIGTKVCCGDDSEAMWRSDSDFHVFYKKHESRAIGLMILEHEDSYMNKIFLFVHPQEKFVWSATRRRPWWIKDVPKSNRSVVEKDFYHMSLPEGQKLFVDVSHNRMLTMARHSIILSIRSEPKT